MPARRYTALTSVAALLCFLLPATVGIAADLWSKDLAFKYLCDGVPCTNGIYHANAKAPLPIIPGWLDLHVMANQGAVFGIGQGQRLLFISVSAAAILFILYLFAVSGRQRFYQIILGMLLAGVIGNLYDRIVYQYVRDMIHFHLTARDLFPYIFNVADSLLCTGVALMIVHSLFQNPKKEVQALQQPA